MLGQVSGGCRVLGDTFGRRAGEEAALHRRPLGRQSSERPALATTTTLERPEYRTTASRAAIATTSIQSALPQHYIARIPSAPVPFDTPNAPLWALAVRCPPLETSPSRSRAATVFPRAHAALTIACSVSQSSYQLQLPFLCPHNKQHSIARAAVRAHLALFGLCELGLHAPACCEGSRV